MSALFNKKNIANILTTSRLFFAAALFFFISPEKQTIFIIIYTIAWLTDFVDGSIARYFNSQSEFGSRMDDIADYTLIIIMISIMIYWIRERVYDLLPLLITMISIRVMNGFITKKKFGKLCIIHTYLNKLTAFIAYFVPVTYILFNQSLIAGYVVLIVGVLASSEETIIHLTSKVYNSERKSYFMKDKDEMVINN